MLQMTCPHCAQSLQIPDQYAGQQGRCNHCGQAITAPQAATVTAPPPFTKATADPYARPDLANINIDPDNYVRGLAPMVDAEDTPRRGATGGSNFADWALRMQMAGLSMTCGGCLLLFFLPAIVFVIILALAALGAG